MNLAFRLAAGGPASGRSFRAACRSTAASAVAARSCPTAVVEVRSGKVEIGQGIVTALAQIAADELGRRARARIRMVAASTAGSPDEAVDLGQPVDPGVGHRAALRLRRGARDLSRGAAARARRAGGPRSGDRRRDRRGRRRAHELLGARRRRAARSRGDRRACRRRSAAPHRRHRDAAARHSATRSFGRPRFVHDLELPGMLHGRVLRPPSPGAVLLSIDDAKARALDGVVAVVRDGSFVGVLAEREEIAVKALERAGAGRVLDGGAKRCPDAATLADWLKAQPVETKVVERTRAPRARRRGAHPARPLHRAPISRTPRSARPARSRSGRTDALHVWSHSQGIYNLRADLALALGMRAERIVVAHVEGAGCYGHNGADDVALRRGAARARVPAGGRYAAMDARGRARLGAVRPGDGGRARSRSRRRRRGRSPGATRSGAMVTAARPGRAATPALLAAAHLERPFDRVLAINPPLPAGGADRNAIPLYDVPARRDRQPPAARDAAAHLGAALARRLRQCVRDRVVCRRARRRARTRTRSAWRLRHLADPRARAVIEAAARRAGWSQMAAARRPGPRHRLRDATRTCGAYCAVVAEIEAEREIRVRRLVDRRRRRPGDQSGRRRQPDRRRRDPGVELDAEGGGALRPHPRHEQQLGGLPDPEVLRSARGRGRDLVTGPICPQSARARRPRDRPRPRSRTRCSTRSACACATCRSRPSASSPPRADRCTSTC